MTFDELPLYEAIYDVRAELDQPGAERWTIDPVYSEQMARAVQSRLPFGVPWSKTDIISAYINFRKASAEKYALKVEVARAHGKVCFYRGRGMGRCSDDIHLDRIYPGSRGGEYTIENCVLVCGTHNCRRQDQTIEDFLRR